MQFLVPFVAQNTILSTQKALRDAFPAQNAILSTQQAPVGGFSAHKAPAGRPSVIPKAKYMTLGPIFFFHCFATQIIKSFYESIIPDDSESSHRDLVFYNIKM